MHTAAGSIRSDGRRYRLPTAGASNAVRSGGLGGGVRYHDHRLTAKASETRESQQTEPTPVAVVVSVGRDVGGSGGGSGIGGSSGRGIGGLRQRGQGRQGEGQHEGGLLSNGQHVVLLMNMHPRLRVLCLTRTV